jgi:hypothetical protein
MRTRSALVALLALAFSASATAAEPPAPASTDEAIVVTGTKTTSKTITRYVHNITSTVDDQIARFRQPICPASFGLPAAYNRVIEQRIRDDAARAGLRVAGERCDANVVLIVADDPGPLVEALRRERPQVFAGLDYNDVRQVLRSAEPVRTWHAIEPRGSDGRPLQRVMSVDGTPGGGNGMWVNPAASNSRIQQNTQDDLVSSFVVIAAQAVDGLTLTQIADYAAMRTLAKTRAPAGLTGPTILALFNKADSRPSELTAWDRGYLRGLYRTSNTLAAHSQESAISGVIQRGLERMADR